MERDVQLLREQGVMVTGAAAAGYMSGDKQLSGTGIGGRVSLADLATGPAPCSSRRSCGTAGCIYRCQAHQYPQGYFQEHDGFSSGHGSAYPQCVF